MSKRKLILEICIILLISGCMSEEMSPREKALELNQSDKFICIIHETPPSPKEGFEIFNRTIQSNLGPQKTKLRGITFIQFKVTKEGILTNFKVI